MTRTGVGNPNARKGKEWTPADVDKCSVSTADSEEEGVSSQLCCLQGCLATSAVGFAFFIGLPSGILLVLYASKNQDVTLLAVGGVLIVLPVVTLLAFVILCLYRQHLRGRARISNDIATQKPTDADTPRY